MEHKKILIVDDEPNIVMTLEYAFKKQNFQVFIARDGKEAMALMKHKLPDIVLLDIMMPAVDGYETLSYMKNSPELVDIKTIFLTAKNKQADIDKGKLLGVDAYMTKPFSVKKVVAQVAHLLN